MLTTVYDNIHLSDRVARLALGAALIATIFQPGFNHYWIALVSVYPIMTAIMAWDPIYALMIKLSARIHWKSQTSTHAPA